MKYEINNYYSDAAKGKLELGTIVYILAIDEYTIYFQYGEDMNIIPKVDQDRKFFFGDHKNDRKLSKRMCEFAFL
jgi:hypothetical protein